jgi:hypothetical protein
MMTFSLGLFASLGLAVAPAHSVEIKGCVAKEGPLTPTVFSGLPLTRRLVKVAGVDGAYRCTLEVEGYALRDVLDRVDVKKKVDDGFDRPLDTFITVHGRGGTRALFSYSEIAFAGDGGPILVEKARLVLPHKHSTLKSDDANPTVFLDPGKRDAINLSACAACHTGDKLLALSLPKGWLLVVPQDGWGGRFVEDVAEIAVKQVGLPVHADSEAGKSGLVEEPLLVGLDGSKTPLTKELFGKGTKVIWQDACFGMGMGYHGVRHWEGLDLGALLRPLVPAGVDPRQVWVLATALDGYRVLYSGGELFTAPEGKGVILADQINGAPLEKGSGRYHAVSKADFYIDRDVRLVKEIRLGLVQ